jgi:hypothetical protein
MSTRAASWLAWSTWAVCVVLIALALVLDFVTNESFIFVPGESPGVKQ